MSVESKLIAMSALIPVYGISLHSDSADTHLMNYERNPNAPSNSESTDPKIKKKKKRVISPIAMKNKKHMMLSESEVTDSKYPIQVDNSMLIKSDSRERTLTNSNMQNGEVMLVDDVDKIYALKEFKILRKGKKIRTSRALEEARILSQLEHENIILHKDVFISGGLFYLVMEYAEKGDLGEQIEMRMEKGKTWSKAFIVRWFAMIVSGLTYLHSHQIMHIDIKPGNILVATDFVLKIADFGLARQMEGSELYADTQCGTRLYMCPEAVLQDEYSYSADVWAMGCVLFQLCMLKRPFEIVKTILKGPIPEIPHTLNGEDTKDLAIICNKMLDRQPKKRISCQDLNNLFQKSQNIKVRTDTSTTTDTLGTSSINFDSAQYLPASTTFQGGSESPSKKGSTNSLPAPRSLIDLDSNATTSHDKTHQSGAFYLDSQRTSSILANM
eukprot:gene166-30_t